VSDELVSDSDRAALVADLDNILGFEAAVRAAVHGETGAARTHAGREEQ
jgi:hypothetical protein